MTAAKNTVTVKKDGAVSDGNGGYHNKGDKIECPSKETADSLRAKGLAE